MHKFRLGQSVYLIQKAGSKFVVDDEMLMVNRLSTDEEGNHYSLINALDDHLDWCREEDVFSSLEQAEQECVRRNTQTTIRRVLND